MQHFVFHYKIYVGFPRVPGWWNLDTDAMALGFHLTLEMEFNLK